MRETAPSQGFMPLEEEEEEDDECFPKT